MDKKRELFEKTPVPKALATLAIPVARALRRMGIGRKIVLDEVKE